MQYAYDILKGELIGRVTRATKLSDQRVFEGKIIDETKHTVVLKIGSQEKRLVKNQHSFEFEHKNKTIKINGALLQKRPEERIKTRLR